MIDKRITKKIFSLFIVIIFASSFFIFGAKDKFNEKEALKNLLPRYKKWLDLVHYIISPTEREVFLKLKTNRDRDAFIDLFWKQRDPTPGTPENEYKTEIEKRFKFVNKFFAFGKPGWMTDRGKIYMILGPPKNRDIIEDQYLTPMEIWSYYGTPEQGLPSAFRVVFYKKDAIGDFKLYDPVSDGPASLLIKSPTGNAKVNLTNDLDVYLALKDLNKDVAEASLSLIPGRLPYNYHPSPGSTILLAKIIESPYRKIDTSYATSFLKFKGVVNVDYATNYIKSKNIVAIIKDLNLKEDFVNIAILPSSVSVDYSDVKEKYYFVYTLSVSLKRNGKIIYEYSKKFPFYFSEKEIKTKLSKGLVVEDLFPVIPGEFDLTVLIQNSIKKEFLYFEKKIKIPEKKSLRIEGPFVYLNELKTNTSALVPFNLDRHIIFVNPKAQFSPSDKMKVAFCVNNNLSKNFKGELEIKNKIGYKEYSSKFPFEIPRESGKVCIIKNIKNPGPGSYIAEVKVFAGKSIVFVSKESSFLISPLNNIAHPVNAYKLIPPDKFNLIYYIIAKEYENSGEIELAKDYYERSLNLKGDSKPVIKDYCKFLIREKKDYKRAEELIEILKKDSKDMFDYYYLKGELLFSQKKYKEALNILLKANKIYDSDYTLINLIGYSYLHLNERDKALKAFRSSILLNPDQPAIKKIIGKD